MNKSKRSFEVKSQELAPSDLSIKSIQNLEMMSSSDIADGVQDDDYLFFFAKYPIEDFHKIVEEKMKTFPICSRLKEDYQISLKEPSAFGVLAYYRNEKSLIAGWYADSVESRFTANKVRDHSKITKLHNALKNAKNGDEIEVFVTNAQSLVLPYDDCQNPYVSYMNEFASLCKSAWYMRTKFSNRMVVPMSSSSTNGWWLMAGSSPASMMRHLENLTRPLDPTWLDKKILETWSAHEKEILKGFEMEYQRSSEVFLEEKKLIEEIGKQCNALTSLRAGYKRTNTENKTSAISKLYVDNNPMTRNDLTKLEIVDIEDIKSGFALTDHFTFVAKFPIEVLFQIVSNKERNCSTKFMLPDLEDMADSPEYWGVVLYDIKNDELRTGWYSDYYETPNERSVYAELVTREKILSKFLCEDERNTLEDVINLGSKMVNHPLNLGTPHKQSLSTFFVLCDCFTKSRRPVNKRNLSYEESEKWWQELSFGGFKQKADELYSPLNQDWLKKKITTMWDNHHLDYVDGLAFERVKVNEAYKAFWGAKNSIDQDFENLPIILIE